MALSRDPVAGLKRENNADSLAPGLYITATPIGNAGDITMRALNVLKNCDAIVAEDTRVTSKLLSLYGISRPLLIYHDHNAASAGPKLLDRLRQGQRLALVTDAGTPLISDPGYRLVRAAQEEGLTVIPVPGPSAVVAALSAAGIPCERFLFVGFLPSKAGERAAALQRFGELAATLVFFESPHRLAETLVEAAKQFPDREVVVARELTKLHEEIRRGSLGDLAAHFTRVPPRGEVVVVLAPASEDGVPNRALVDSLLRQALPFMPLKAAAALVAEATATARRQVYTRALEIMGDADDDGP